jgi:probable HAF family extracellular repeat protein
MATVTTLVTAPLTGASEANAINDAGAVVGAEDNFPYIWEPLQPNDTNGSATQLPILPSPVGSGTAKAINVRGDVAGSSETVDSNGVTVLRAVLWRSGAGVAEDLGTLNPGSFGAFFDSSRASDVNDFGQVVGRSHTPSGEVHAFLFDSSVAGATMQDLGTLPGGTTSQATGITSNGDIVGVSDTVDSLGTTVQRAFIVPSGASMVELGTLIEDPSTPGGFLENSAASDINDLNRIVGKSDAGGFTAAGDPLTGACEFFRNQTPTAILPMHSEATGIGPKHHIVGRFDLPAKGFVFHVSTGMDDLSATTGMTIVDALGVNAIGQVVASANTGTATIGVLITP